VSLTKKVKIEEQTAEIFRVSRELKKQVALRSLLYLDPSTARWMFAAELRDRVSLALKERSVFRKMEKLESSRLGRSYINNVVISSAKKYIREGTVQANLEGFGKISVPTHNRDRLKLLREELSKLYANRDVKGSRYIEEVRNIIYRVFDSKTAQKIERELFTRISMVELGKKGLLDPVDGRAFLRSKDRPVGFKIYDVNQIGEARKELGVRWNKVDYFEMKVGRLMLEAIRSSDSAKEVAEKFLKLYEEEKQRDPLFKQAEAKGAFKYLQQMYSAAAFWGSVEKVAAEIPARLVSLASRMLAATYRMLPLVGAIAAVNAEAAVAIAELGEGLKSKVEQSAYMPISLKDLFGEEKGKEIKKIIENNLRQKKQAN